MANRLLPIIASVKTVRFEILRVKGCSSCGKFVPTFSEPPVLFLAAMKEDKSLFVRSSLASCHHFFFLLLLFLSILFLAFSQVWLKRNRAGGLQDSIALLDHTLKLLLTASTAPKVI